ncbi:bromodomain-containing protein 8-like [Nymphalis io]|uniref:bromodomain-containing protein 8-like n=1 Tax=Inachis io TaxID=171585 RepID=UPI002169953B|nr:bromodomain-containing protein 8-like [Nymphalis io]
MSSVQERLQLKRVPLDTWNVREQLCLASAVVRSGDQNWMSVSRALKTVGEPNRPPDWYSQKSCAAQYGALLEHVDTPKRKKRNSEGGVETPQESILKQLTQQRILEIQGTLSEMNNQYEQLKNEIAEVRSQTTTDDRIQELWSGIEAAKRARERECARRAAWLKEREERRARAERTWRPSQTPPPTTPTTAPPSSPLLTSLLKSSPVVTTPQHIPHPATVVDSVSPSAGAPTLSLLLEQAQDSKNAAIEHIKSQLVQIEHQLKASTQATVVPQPVIQPAPAVDIDDIEIKAEDVYAFRDIDINIPPVTALHKGNVRVAEKPAPKKEIEAPASEPEVVEPPIVEVKEEPVPETTIVEDMTPNEMETVEEEKSPQTQEEKETEPKEAEVKISFPEVKFPTLEIKVIQLDEQKDSQIKEEVKEPEPEPEPTAPEERTEIMEEDKEETRTQEEKIADEPEAIDEPPAPVAEEAVEPPPAAPQPEEEIITDPQDIPLPPEIEAKEEEKEAPEIIQPSEPEPEEPAKVTAEVVEEKEKTLEEPVPEETEKKEEVPEESVEDKLIEDIKKEDDAEDSIPLKEMIKEELSQEEVKREGVEEDTHTETDDDTPMELSREEEKDGKKKRDYSRKKKSDSRTCSGSESAPESPSASDAERQHRLWKKSVMLVYSRLCAHKYASLFLRPISDEEAPGYSVVVKRPMDLSTVRRNIDAGNVRTTAEFQRDVLLMLSNALLYNSSSHSVYAMAREMHEDAQCQLGMLLAAQAHAGLCAPPRRKRRLDAHAHAHGKHHRA